MLTKLSHDKDAVNGRLPFGDRGEDFDLSGITVKMKDAKFAAPFKSGLEYGAPARGTWNIVHIGMLVPEAHEIFVCAAGCLRGVVLTAAEMGTSDRFSTIEIRENNVLDGDMEELIIDGTEDIINKLPYRPRAILIYTSCIHHFMSVDLDRVYDVLREKFPDIDFTDCYMNPIMRKSGMTPDQLMRHRLYTLIHERELDPKAVNILGSTSAIDETSEMVRLIKGSGYKLRQIMDFDDYDGFQEMAEGSLNITIFPSAKIGGEEFSARTGARHLYLHQSFNFDVIEEQMGALAEALGVEKPDYSEARASAEQALKGTALVLGDTEIVIDYTVVPECIGLAELLTDYGMNVSTVFVDSVAGDDEEAFYRMKEKAPEMKLMPTVHHKMRVLPRTSDDKIVAIGQKAAYFTGTANFVNVVEGAGFQGYDGIVRLCELIVDAYENEKDTRSLVTIKGLGCGEGCSL